MEVIPRHTVVVSVREIDQVGDARRRAVALAKQINLGETVSGKIALIATEMATNLVKHAGGGQLLVRVLHGGENAHGLELLSLDRGRGSSRSHEWLRDGYSTAGSAGQGLGAIQRLSHVFDFHSAEGLGTAVLSRIWEKPPAIDDIGARVGAICVPIEGETECGDAFAVLSSGGRTRMIVADGLGHGILAAEASEAAVRMVGKQIHTPILPAMEGIHRILRATRGAAVAIADVELGGEINFVGVGNIAAFIVHLGERRGMVSSSGIVGHDARRLHVFQHNLPAGSVLILHSDGLTSRWDLSSGGYQTLLARHPALIAGILFRDFSRGRDDATIVVLKASA